MPPTPYDLARRADEVVSHLRQFEVWAPSMTGATVDGLSDEVHDLAPVPGDPEKYRLFTFRRSARITGRLLLDPRDAKVLEVRGVKHASVELPPFVDPMAALRRHPASAPLPAVPASDWTMVWKYSSESSSRFTPFWMTTINHQAWYVRVDGEIFTELTPLNR
jgi:hypothetical protein